MIKTRQRKLTFALLALLFILAGCKGESPTAPPPVGPGPGGTPGGGGTTPPTNASISLAASNLTPLVNSNSEITATVTVDGQPVPNGTAVQFNTNLGTFIENGGVAVLRTTTNGVASVKLTSAAAGTATVTATVGNVSRTIQVTFSTLPVTPPVPSTAPTISSISPAFGKPEGGDTIVIRGTNFRGPVRVLFDIGGGRTAEGFVVQDQVTPNQITVVTPAVNVGTGQVLATDVIVITEAGSASEQRVVKAQGFTFQSAVMTPSIVVINPSTGPSTGNTRITITGSGFQAPVQVTFGGAPTTSGGPLNSQVELLVLEVNFNRIIATTPEQRLIDPTLIANNGAVTVRVLNIASAKDAILAGGFRYLPKMQITTVGPTEGTFNGGTRITIDGIGFDSPLAVVVAGVAAQVVRVSGSQLIVISSPVQVTSCADVTGPITVTNTNNGDSAIGPNFRYRVPKPVITSISNPNTAGGTATVTVLNAQGLGVITIGGVQASITARTDSADGSSSTFTVQIPATVRLDTVSCPSGGLAPMPTAFDVVYTNLVTLCTVTSVRGLTVNPAPLPVLFLNPGAFQPFTATITPATAGPPPTPARVTASSTQTVNIVNTGANCPAATPCPLTITGITTAGAGCANFSVATPPIPPNVNLNQCETLPVIVQYRGQTTATTETCTVTITTNSGTRTLLLVGTSQ